MHEPEGNDDENNLYADDYSNFSSSNVYSGNRTLYNVFYVRNMSGNSLVEPFGQGAFTSEDDSVRTHVSNYEDGGSYVYTLSTHLEDMYRRFAAGPGIASWSRQITYLRPNRFVVYDRTQKGRADYDQYLAFNFPGAPTSSSSPAGTLRVNVNSGGNFAGAMTSVLPTSTVGLPIAMYPGTPSGKVWQLQLRAPDTALSQRWLTVFDLSSTSATVAEASSVTVDTPNMVGVYMAAVDENSVVLSSTGAAGTPVSGPITYRIPAAATHHILTELQPSTGYSIAVVAAGTQYKITVVTGGSYATSANGVLEFRTAADGTILNAVVGGVCGSDDGKTLFSSPVNLCSIGVATSVLGSGPWTWTCQGSGGGTNASCAAQKSDTPPLFPTTTTLALIPNPAEVGESITATVNVTETGPAFRFVKTLTEASFGAVRGQGSALEFVTGSATVSGGGKTCTAALVNGSGNCSLVFMAAASLVVGATYSGDPTHSVSSDAQILTVGPNAVVVGNNTIFAAPSLDSWALIALLLSLAGAIAYRRYRR